MWELILASLLWAASYSINKEHLAGFNPFLISTIFCLSSWVIFLPCLKISRIPGKTISKLLAIGAVQFGLMYVFFQSAFFFLAAHELAILLITTPFYVVLIDGIYTRRTLALPLFLAILCIFLSFCILGGGAYAFNYFGILLTQLSNAAFAGGQVLLKRFFERHSSINLRNVIGILYIGGGMVCLIFALASHACNYSPITLEACVYACLLGIICCGVCHYLWDAGAIKVKTPLLALMNNAQIPLAVLVSTLCFGEIVQMRKILASVAMIALIALVAAVYKRIEKR
jgi:drug/metabolite transporter (DMT)-like permease